MATFVLATANAHKAEEIRRVVEPYGIELLDRPLDVADVEETEETLEGNALLKARALTDATGLAAIADDTGLFIDALEGRPGVYSARYAGENATFADNVSKALTELDGVDDAATQRPVSLGHRGDLSRRHIVVGGRRARWHDSSLANR